MNEAFHSATEGARVSYLGGASQECGAAGEGTQPG